MTDDRTAAVRWLEEQFDEDIRTGEWALRVAAFNWMISLKEDHDCPRKWCRWTTKGRHD